MSQLFVLYCTNYNIDVLIINNYYLVFLYQFGWSPLRIAARLNNVEVASVLIEAGADLDIPDKVMICFILIKLQMYYIVYVQLIKSSEM